MPLNQLLATAFKEGAGISLDYAHRTPRCRELQDLARQHKLLDPEDTGLTEYLGERIADRAAKNLPASVRHNLHLWGQGLEAQRKLLDEVFGNLNAKTWRGLVKERQRYDYNSDVRSVLPHAAGSWNRGGAMPNCLGVAQMLVGLARAVGARHYLVNTVENWEVATLGVESHFLRKTLELMQDNPTTNQAVRKALRLVRRAYAQSLRGLAGPSMAHHALMVELADGNWWIVDPYLITMYQLPDDEERVAAAAQVDTKRQHVVYVSNPAESSLDRYRTRFRVLHTTLSYMLALIEGRYVRQDIDLEIPAALACAAAYGQHRYTKWSDAFSDELIEVSTQPEMSDPEFLTDSSHAYHWALAPRYGDDPPLESAEIDRLIRDSERDPVLEQRVSWRVVALFLHTMLEFTDFMHKNQLIRRHRSYEITSPALMLGVATLNHLSSSAPEARLGGKLAAMSSSQWILADSLAAKERGDVPEEMYDRLMADRLSRYNQRPIGTLIPPLRHLGK